MITSRRGFLSGLAGAIFAPAIVRADSLMKLHQIPERWATVWGVGWDYEVVEVPLWKPMSVGPFGASECLGGHIDKFREVTDWVYTNPPASITPPTRYPHWHDRNHYINDLTHGISAEAIATRDYGAYVTNNLRTGKPVVQEDGFTRTMGLSEMREWAESLQDAKV